MIAQVTRNSTTFRSNIEAEESILGGVLLDPNAIERIASILQPEAFSVPTHQMIYRIALQIHASGERVDLMSVTTLLADRGQLEAVGGQLKIAQLVDRTVSTVNIDQYAALVIREFLFRKLTQVGHEITQIASEAINPQDILEEVENKVISLTRSYKAGIFERESVTRFKQISKQLERIEDEHDDNPALKEWELRQLASKYEFRNVRDLLNFHAKWLQSRKTKRSVGLQAFWEQNNAPQQWIMRGFLPRKSLNILWGTGGVGKTLLTGSICHKLITGEAWADYPTEQPTEVLLIETDQGRSITAAQLEAQGFLDCDERTKSRFRVLSDWSLEEFGVLRRELSEIRAKSPNAPVLVVVDSLTSVSTNSMFSENDKEFARPLERLREIAERFDCSFLVLHHGSKKKEMRGTTAIHNSADQVFKLERVDREKGVPTSANLTIEKSRFRLEGVYRLKYRPDERLWDLEGKVSSIDGIRGDEETIENASATFQKIYRFLDSTRGSRYDIPEICEATDLTRTPVSNELAWGVAEGLIDHARSDRPKNSPGRRPRLFFLPELELSDQDNVTPIVNNEKSQNRQNSKPLHSNECAVLNKGENQFCLLEKSENSKSPKKTRVKIGKIGKIPEPAHGKGLSESQNSEEKSQNRQNSNPLPDKGLSDSAPDLKDYYSLKPGDVLVKLDSSGNPYITQITNTAPGNMWATNKPSEFVSLSDWKAGLVRRPTAQDVAASIERTPSRKWFRWLHRNLEKLQILAIEIIAEFNPDLVERCYDWLNPLELNQDQVNALDDLRLTLNEKGRHSQKQFLKIWGSDGEKAIQFAEEEGRITIKKGWIKLAGT